MNYITKKPELLAPAGDFDKMKVAFLYGADAVYIGAKNFGLRSAAGNFTIKQIEEAVKIAHNRNKKIYLVVNTLVHNHEISLLKKFLNEIKYIQIDALIISDAGVFNLAKSITNFEIHLSTQASAVNYESAKFWKECGVTRIILGREASFREACEIFDKSGLDIEIFIHGSMCMSYSGKCTISNFLSLRDANRGGCTNSCRWNYQIKNTKYDNIHLLNSRDLWAIELIPDIVTSGKICSLKIEGRMKNHLYIANTVSTYRKAIDTCYDLHRQGINPMNDYKDMLPKMKYELKSNMNRTYTNGFLKSIAGKDSVLYDNLEKYNIFDNMGNIIEKISDIEYVVDIKNPTHLGDYIEILIPMKDIKCRKIVDIKDLSGRKIKVIPNNRMAYITIDKPIECKTERFTVIRKPVIRDRI